MAKIQESQGTFYFYSEMVAYKWAVMDILAKFQESQGNEPKPSIYADLDQKNLYGTEWNVYVFRFRFAPQTKNVWRRIKNWRKEKG